MAHRDLLRRENAANRIPGVLGIHVARAKQSLAFSEVDGGDGAPCPPAPCSPKTEGSIWIAQLSGDLRAQNVPVRLLGWFSCPNSGERCPAGLLGRAECARSWPTSYRSR